ncbi:protein FAR1-RELATED SEQUENCE 6-like [Arachis stenosperma]|uniref:protein FAR1-RELATED SEQUENCE 6-like n=1 Tax=Arachis stenosperma TaxID=217475 RepID=UPI0025ABA51D|nr:protein FAR1-RELATED SEQUENCE 6-like [Arachis stenosperma]
MKEINSNFFYAIGVDDANKFRSALWVDARCRASYEYYGDVVSFDTTYRRNRHDLPFASFVGVNHHGKSSHLGCTLLGSEEIPSFEWVFTQLVRCVGTAPRGIITNQCKAMAGAIRKLGGYARYGELNAMMNHIMWNSPSTELFEVDWDGFIKQFNLGQNRWLAELRQYRADMFFLDGVRMSSAKFYNIAQEFVAFDEKAAILQSALWDAKSKLTDYHASMRSTTVAATQNTMPT